MKYELQIDGMTCLACEKSVEQALAALPGVQQGTVSYATKRGHVTGDERVTPEALRRAVADAGYHATVDGDAPLEQVLRYEIDASVAIEVGQEHLSGSAADGERGARGGDEEILCFG